MLGGIARMCLRRSTLRIDTNYMFGQRQDADHDFRIPDFRDDDPDSDKVSANGPIPRVVYEKPDRKSPEIP